MKPATISAAIVVALFSSTLASCQALSSPEASGGGAACAGADCSTGLGGTAGSGGSTGSGGAAGVAAGTGGKDDIAVGAGGGGADPPDGPACLDIQVSYEEPIPSVVLLIDRSLSMNGTLGFSEAVAEEVGAGSYVPWGCPTLLEDPLDAEDQRFPDWRWNVVRSVLFHPENGVVAGWENRVRFGMTLYTSFVPGPSEAVCPELRQVGLGLANRAALLEAMPCHDIGAETDRKSVV